MDPKVSFVIPCYKLAHLLPDCVNSILNQTCQNFEVLILDDCSPDQTPQVAQSFHDQRVIHVRNEKNLGHLRNYNKGIALARGKYVWLISADDCLRKPYAVERYVKVMEEYPQAGYVFSPAMRLQDGQETEVVSWGMHGTQDKIFKGHDFLKKLIWGNCVVAPAGMVRKECYDKISVFPLDMPNSGDWYLWCIFALYHDVAYLAEPMVYYRSHDTNMSKLLTQNERHTIITDNVTVRWRMKEKAETRGASAIVRLYEDAIATYYANLLAYKTDENSIFSITLEEFERSLLHYARSKSEELKMRTRVYTALGDQWYVRRDFSRALQYYGWAVQKEPWALGTQMKYMLLKMGGLGVHLRDSISALMQKRSVVPVLK